MPVSPLGVPKSLALIVNRDSATLTLLRSVIEESGALAVTLNEETLQRPEDLLAIVAEHRPRVVLYDIPYPYPASKARFLALRDSEQPLAVTWIAMTTSREVAAELRADGQQVCLGKPFDFDELMATVGTALGWADQSRAD